MKSWRKRLLSIICVVALVVTSVYVADYKKAKAATATSEIVFDLAAINYQQGWVLQREINITYTGVATDYNYGIDFLDESFIEKYVTFGGGMTSSDLLEGLTKSYLANSSVFQLKWGDRMTSFEPGWSFTIEKGALIPYGTTAGSISYMALDKEYAFSFRAGWDNYANIVDLAGYYVTTYSLNTDEYVANKKVDPSETNIWFTIADDVAISPTSEYILDNAMYEEYIDIKGLTFAELKNAGVELKAYIGANALQFYNWGTLRSTLSKGDQIVFGEGMPLYYEDTSGNKWKAVLDGTYVYECMYDYTVQNEHDQVFDGAKVDSDNMFRMNTGTVSVANIEGNFGFAWSAGGAQNTEYIEENILAETIAEDYIEYIGCTANELVTNNAVKLMLIPTANVLQIEIYDTNVLQVGDQIILKDGLPIAWNNGGNRVAYAVLEGNYTFTVTSNDGTNVQVSCVGRYGLSQTVTKGSDTGYVTDAYFNILFNKDEIPEDEEFVEGFTVGWDVLQEYFSLSGYTTEQIQANITLKRYNIGALRGLRVLYNVSNITFVEGTEMVFKKGLPITYNISPEITKTWCLDKDYGFVYNASAGSFTYDPSLGNVEEETTETFHFISTGADSFYEVEAYRTNLSYSTNLGEATDATAVPNILTSTGEEGNTRDYVEIFGLEPEVIDALGIKITLYPADGTTTFQMVWGADVFEWIENGMILTFKAGMPVYYATGDVMYLTADTSYQVTSITKPTGTGNGVFVLSSYEPPLPVKKFSLFTEGDPSKFAIPNTNGGEAYIDILNAETGEANVLDDVQTTAYKWIGGGAEVDYAQFVKWVDFAGLTAEELEAYGVKLRLVGDGATQLLQIFWGTSFLAMGEGSQITFKAGMPFTYNNKEGKSQTIELDKDYTFEAREDNKYYYFTTENSGNYILKYGTTYVVAQEPVAPGVIHYYNNIDMIGGELLADNTAMRVAVPVGTLMKYLEFGNIDPIHYEALGIAATLIIDGDDKVIQLDWGRPGEHTITDANGNTVTTTDLVKDGDKITFKAGMAIQTEVDSGQKQRYVLDKSYTYTIEAHSTGANGYRLSGVVKEEEKITAGDADGDYMLNQNDITLLRKQLVGLIAVSNTACVNANEDKDGVISSADLVRAKRKWNVAEPETYATIFKNCEIPTITIKKGATISTTDSAIGMNAISIADNNYIRLTYSTTEDIYGTFHYTNNGTQYEENFYLPAKDVQFEQFFDNYRINGILGTTKATAKTLTKITFRNVGEDEATFNLVEVEVANRPFENSDMLYVNNGSLKIGVDLNQGGSLAYMEDLVNKPIEYVTSSWGDLKIATEKKYSSGSNPLKEVNLVNVYDLGRQMQQSYYIDVKDTSYKHGQYNNNSSWPYNPVQAGDKNEHQSQIIDYRKIDTDGDKVDDMIYVKVRAMDWADPNPNGTDTATARGTTTESYMENWFRISDDLLYVDNSFVDWSGWQSIGDPVNQELPAFYTLASMNYFVAGNDTTTRKTYGNWTNETDRYHVTGEDTSDWYAWVNANADDAYGLGIYIPNAHACTAGRGQKSSNVSFLYPSNRGAEDAEIFDVIAKYGTYLQDMYKGTYQNCFLGNTSYIAATALVALQEYTTYNYTYVLHANELNEMSETFEDLEDEVTNSQLSGW